MEKVTTAIDTHNTKNRTKILRSKRDSKECPTKISVNSGNMFSTIKGQKIDNSTKPLDFEVNLNSDRFPMKISDLSNSRSPKINTKNLFSDVKKMPKKNKKSEKNSQVGTAKVPKKPLELKKQKIFICENKNKFPEEKSPNETSNMKKVTKSMIQSFQKFKQENPNIKNDFLEKNRVEERKKFNQVIINNCNTKKLHITIDNSNDLLAKSGNKRDKSPTFLAAKSLKLSLNNQSIKKPAIVSILEKDAFVKEKNKDKFLEKQKRKKLGLNFLNKLSTKKIKGIVNSNKTKVRHLDDIRRESNFSETNPKVIEKFPKRLSLASPKLKDATLKQDVQHTEERLSLFNPNQSDLKIKRKPQKMSLRPKSPTFTSTINDRSRSPKTENKYSAKTEKFSYRNNKKPRRTEEYGGLSNSENDLNSNNRRNRSTSPDKAINSSINLDETSNRKNSRNLSKEKKLQKQRLLKFRENLQEKIKKNSKTIEKKPTYVEKNSSVTLNIDKESFRNLNKKINVENIDIKGAKMKNRPKNFARKTTNNDKVEFEGSYSQTKEGNISFTEKSAGNIKNKKVKTDLGKSNTLEDSNDIGYNFYPPNIRMKKNIHIKSKQKSKTDFHNKTVDHHYHLRNSDKKKYIVDSVNLSKITNDTKKSPYFDTNAFEKNNLDKKHLVTDVNIYNSAQKRKVKRTIETENSDEEEFKMSDIEIFHAAAIFIQKHIRGFLIRAKQLAAYEAYLIQYELGNVSHDDLKSYITSRMYLNRKEKELVTRLEQNALYSNNPVNYESVRRKIYNNYINYETKYEEIQNTYKKNRRKNSSDYKNNSSVKATEDDISDENFVYRPLNLGTNSKKEDSKLEQNEKYTNAYNSSLNNTKKPPKIPNGSKKEQTINTDKNYDAYQNNNMSQAEKDLSDSQLNDSYLLQLNDSSFNKNKGKNNNQKVVDKSQYYSSGDSWYKRNNRNNSKDQNISNTSYNSFTNENAEAQNSFKNEIISEKIANSLNNSNNKALECDMNSESIITKLKKIQQSSQKQEEALKILVTDYKKDPIPIEQPSYNVNSPSRGVEVRTKLREDIFPNSINTFSTSNDYTANNYNDKDLVIFTSNKSNPFKNDVKDSVEKLDITKQEILNTAIENTQKKDYINEKYNNTVENFKTQTNFLSEFGKTDYIVDQNSIELKSKLIKSLDYSKENGFSNESQDIEDHKDYILIKDKAGNIIEKLAKTDQDESKSQSSSTKNFSNTKNTTGVFNQNNIQVFRGTDSFMNYPDIHASNQFPDKNSSSSFKKLKNSSELIHKEIASYIESKLSKSNNFNGNIKNKDSIENFKNDKTKGAQQNNVLSIAPVNLIDTFKENKDIVNKQSSDSIIDSQKKYSEEKNSEINKQEINEVKDNIKSEENKDLNQGESTEIKNAQENSHPIKKSEFEAKDSPNNDNQRRQFSDIKTINSIFETVKPIGLSQDLGMRKFAKEELVRWEEITHVMKDFKTYCNENKSFEDLYAKINICSEGAKQALINKFHISTTSMISLKNNLTAIQADSQLYPQEINKYQNKKTNNSQRSMVKCTERSLYSENSQKNLEKLKVLPNERIPSENRTSSLSKKSNKTSSKKHFDDQRKDDIVNNNSSQLNSSFEVNKLNFNNSYDKAYNIDAQGKGLSPVNKNLVTSKDSNNNDIGSKIKTEIKNNLQTVKNPTVASLHSSTPEIKSLSTPSWSNAYHDSILKGTKLDFLLDNGKKIPEEPIEKDLQQAKNSSNDLSISKNSKKKFYKKDEMELWVNPISLPKEKEMINSSSGNNLVNSSSGNNVINSPKSSVKDNRSSELFRVIDKKMDDIIKHSKKDTDLIFINKSQKLQKKDSYTSETFSEKVTKKSISNKNDSKKSFQKPEKTLFNFAEKVEDLENSKVFDDRIKSMSPFMSPDLEQLKMFKKQKSNKDISKKNELFKSSPKSEINSNSDYTNLIEKEPSIDAKKYEVLFDEPVLSYNLRESDRINDSDFQEGNFQSVDKPIFFENDINAVSESQDLNESNTESYIELPTTNQNQSMGVTKSAQKSHSRSVSNDMEKSLSKADQFISFGDRAQDNIEKNKQVSPEFDKRELQKPQNDTAISFMDVKKGLNESEKIHRMEENLFTPEQEKLGNVENNPQAPKNEVPEDLKKTENQIPGFKTFKKTAPNLSLIEDVSPISNAATPQNRFGNQTAINKQKQYFKKYSLKSQFGNSPLDTISAETENNEPTNVSKPIDSVDAMIPDFAMDVKDNSDLKVLEENTSNVYTELTAFDQNFSEITNLNPSSIENTSLTLKPNLSGLSYLNKHEPLEKSMKKLNSLDKITQEETEAPPTEKTTDPEDKDASVMKTFSSLNETKREIVLTEIGKFIENKLLEEVLNDELLISVVAAYIIGNSSNGKSEDEEKTSYLNKNFDEKTDIKKLDSISDDSSDTETVYGIRTNFNAVNEYLNLLIKYLKDNVDKINFGVDDVYNPQRKLDDVYMLRNTNVNMVSEEEQKKEKCWQIPTLKNSVLNDKMFNDLENEILSNYQNMNIMKELFEMQRIYHRAIFDCFNESLTRQSRELEVKLSDMLFSTKRNPKSKIITLDQMFLKAMEDVQDCASLLCGIIKDKEDSMMGNIRYMDNELINQLREERMYRMITLENIERDKTWFDFDNHETLVKLQISESILDRLAMEAAQDLQEQRQNKGNKSYLNTTTHGKDKSKDLSMSMDKTVTENRRNLSDSLSIDYKNCKGKKEKIKIEEKDRNIHRYIKSRERNSTKNKDKQKKHKRKRSL